VSLHDVCSFRVGGFVFGIEERFPPRRDVGTRPGARTRTRVAKRSGALEGFAESCASGLSWHTRPAEGETKLDSSCEF
jgi:hypothetical protein